MARDPDRVVEGRVCVDCGEAFLLTEGEIAFFVHRGLMVPKRCEGCRAARKRQAGAADAGGRSGEARGRR
jgi:hypothetical protein